MDVLTEDQHRALAFIEACNSQGYGPKAEEVETWLHEPAVPLSPMSSFAVAARWTGLTQGRVTDQLVWLEWVIEGRGRLYVERLGTALLRDADAKIAEVAAATTVVLGARDPLAYAALMSELASAGAGLLVDPYIRREQLLHIAQDTKLNRLLISDKIKPKEMDSLRALLGYLPEDRRLEVRVTDDAHDRYLVAEDGGVYIIGSSMGTVAGGKSTTVLTPFPEDSRGLVATMLEDRWVAGPLVRPSEPADVSQESAG